jgi:hypothetical protein
VCLAHLDFGLVSSFELRTLDLPGSNEPGRLALFFRPPSFSAQKPGTLGLFGVLGVEIARLRRQPLPCPESSIIHNPSSMPRSPRPGLGLFVILSTPAARLPGLAGTWPCPRRTGIRPGVASGRGFLIPIQSRSICCLDIIPHWRWPSRRNSRSACHYPERSGARARLRRCGDAAVRTVPARIRGACRQGVGPTLGSELTKAASRRYIIGTGTVLRSRCSIYLGGRRKRALRQYDGQFGVFDPGACLALEGFFGVLTFLLNPPSPAAEKRW